MNYCEIIIWYLLGMLKTSSNHLKITIDLIPSFLKLLKICIQLGVFWPNVAVLTKGCFHCNPFLCPLCFQKFVLYKMQLTLLIY